MRRHRYRAVIFDKDGTLLDVEQTWSPAIAAAIVQTSDDRGVQRQLAEVMGFDLQHGALLSEAPIMTLTNAQIARMAEPLVDGWAFINSVAHRVVDTVTPVPDAEHTLDSLAALGISLAVVTNDDESSAIEQLSTLGWASRFDPIYGYDSGHGCKPQPGVVLAAMRALGARPEETLMVGDSSLDLLAARAAGITAVLVGSQRDNDHLADVCIAQLSDVLALL